MNYGYDSSTPLWKEDRKETLAQRLKELAKLYGSFVEVDRFYDGVRLRQLTRLSEDDLRNLVQMADTIFVEVMK
jgi:hypothetical protein